MASSCFVTANHSLIVNILLQYTNCKERFLKQPGGKCLAKASRLWSIPAKPTVENIKMWHWCHHWVLIWLSVSYHQSHSICISGIIALFSYPPLVITTCQYCSIWRISQNPCHEICMLNQGRALWQLQLNYSWSLGKEGLMIRMGIDS